MKVIDFVAICDPFEQILQVFEKLDPQLDVWLKLSPIRKTVIRDDLPVKLEFH
jgi:hypothetical protein